MIAPPTTSPAERVAGVALATLAAVTAAAGSAAWPAVVATAVVGVAALPVGRWLSGASLPVRRAATAAVVLAVLFPLVTATIFRLRTGTVVPVEGPLLAGCRNALVGLAATAAGPRAWRRLAAASLFVVLLASVRLSPAAAVPLLAGYVAAGCAWLAVTHRPAGGAAVGPAAVTATVLAVAGTLLGAAAVSGRGIGATVRGFLPSSGGAGAGSELATSGLGNGPDEVPGSSQARSAGFDQSETFMNSEQSGLYDAFLETAGEPLKKGTFEKLQMLRAKQIKWAASTGVEDFRGGRRFTLDRQAPPPTAAAESHAATALLYVGGPLPVHLRAAAYDAFDGAAWSDSGTVGWPGHELRNATAADPWFAVGPGGGRAYQVRVGTLAIDALPLPPLAARFHMGRVTTASLLGWKRPDVLRMRRASVPPGTVLDADCTPFDPARFTTDNWVDDLSSMRATVGVIADRRVSRLARELSAGRPRGWPQVAAVVDGVRNRCTLDRAYRPADADAADRVAEFLFASRRGPDYLFASAAAVMLRELGYTVRLAGGFYVTDGDRDAKTGQAAVRNAAAHTWAEVRLPDGRWAVAEATPGCLVLGPDAPVRQRAVAVLRAHAVGIAAVVATVVAAVIGRLWLVDAATSLLLRLFPGQSWPAVARRTLAVVEWRARWAGRRRPAAMTPRRWLASLDARPAVDRFAEVATWAAYGPAEGPWSVADVRAACASAARHLTAARLYRGQHP